MSKLHPNRRSFLMTALTASAGLLSTSTRAENRAFKTRHVVILGIAGGLRLRESLGMAEGATFRNLFGEVPLAPGYGAGPAGAVRYAPEYLAMPQAVVPEPLGRPLYTQGTLIRNLRYAEGAAGHLQGQACLITGAYNQIENRADASAPSPTLFEVHRRRKNAPARDAFYISAIGGFYRALLSSAHPEYGKRYAGSLFSPPRLMSAVLPLIVSGKRTLQVEGARLPLPYIRNTPKEMAAVAKLRGILDSKFPAYEKGALPFAQSEEETRALEEHLASFYGDPLQTAYFPPEVGIGLRAGNGNFQGSGDALTIYHAEQILRRFRPAVTAITLIDIDQGHFSFNDYLRGQVLADACARRLWETIESTEGLAGQTTLLILPEHGRHLKGNGQGADSLGRSALDHGMGDDGDRDVWALALGPDIAKGRIVEKTTVMGPGRTSGRYETIDVTMTAAALLGHDQDLARAQKDLGHRPGLLIEELFQ